MPEPSPRYPEELLLHLLDSSFDSVLLCSPEKGFLYVSPAFEHLSGYRPDELMADPALFERILHPDDREAFLNHIDDIAAPEHARIDLRLTAKNGEIRWFTHTCKPLFSAATGQQIGRVSHNRDITARKAEELRLRATIEQNRRFNDALDHIGAFVFMRDAKYRFAYANKLTLEFFGTPVHRLIGVTDTHFFPPDTIRQLRLLDQRVLAGEDVAGEVTIARGNGSFDTYWVIQTPIFAESHQGPVVGITGIATDISAQRRNEQELARNLDYQRELNKKLEAARMQLLQAEKMASIGQLAAGVAHEINNPIGFASSNLKTMQDYVADLCAITDAYAKSDTSLAGAETLLAHAHELRNEKDYDFIRADMVQLLEETQAGLARVARIVSDLRDFSHPGEVSWQEADLHQELEASVRMAGIPEGCRIIRDFGELPRIRCNPSELNQVFINLLKNALHAVEYQGVITLRTLSQDNQISVAITDNGCGIPAESLHRIFDPFFTTKPIGQGTGLGLALVHGIVTKHGGRIDVSSTPGQGATFTIRLPVTPSLDESTAVP